MGPYCLLGVIWAKVHIGSTEIHIGYSGILVGATEVHVGEWGMRGFKWTGVRVNKGES